MAAAGTLGCARDCVDATCHTRVMEGVNSFKSVSTFENNCLEEKMTFGDPLEDAGVVRKFIVSHGIIKGKGLQFPGTNFVDKTLKPPESTYKTTFMVLNLYQGLEPFPLNYTLENYESPCSCRCGGATHLNQMSFLEDLVNFWRQIPTNVRC